MGNSPTPASLAKLRAVVPQLPTAWVSLGKQTWVTFPARRRLTVVLLGAVVQKSSGCLADWPERSRAPGRGNWQTGSQGDIVGCRGRHESTMMGVWQLSFGQSDTPR